MLRSAVLILLRSQRGEGAQNTFPVKMSAAAVVGVEMTFTQVSLQHFLLFVIWGKHISHVLTH